MPGTVPGNQRRKGCPQPPGAQHLRWRRGVNTDIGTQIKATVSGLLNIRYSPFSFPTEPQFCLVICLKKNSVCGSRDDDPILNSLGVDRKIDLSKPTIIPRLGGD